MITPVHVSPPTICSPAHPPEAAVATAAIDADSMQTAPKGPTATRLDSPVSPSAPGSREKASFAAEVERYTLGHYPRLWPLSSNVVKQLSLLSASHFTTPEAHTQPTLAPDFALDVEVKRSLARLNSFELLLGGEAGDYRAFVSGQREASLNPVQFNDLHRMIAALSEAGREAVRATCVIAPSRALGALATHHGVNLPQDSEDFLTEIVTVRPDLLPVFDTMSADARKLLPYAYLPRTHMRHMLYTEGNDGMFSTLRSMIEAHSLPEEGFAVWVGRWVTNIAGFRGHVEPAGGSYLDAPTAGGLQILREQLEVLRMRPEFDILGEYLGERGRALGLPSLYLAHIACLARLHDPSDADQLRAAFLERPCVERQALEHLYADSRYRRTPSPTFVPALLDNLRGSIGQKMAVFWVVEQRADQAYRCALQAGDIDENTPISFAALARQDLALVQAAGGDVALVVDNHSKQLRVKTS